MAQQVDSGPAELADPAVATVEITNLTKGQILTPAVFITHGPDSAPLFVPGQPASRELAAIAEQGSTIGLINLYRADPGVLSVTRLAAFVRPGRTASVDVTFDADHRLLSSASMLEMTNDGFVSVLAVEVPCEGSRTYLVGAWDAGSEANSELCSQIPAPCPSPRRAGSCSPGGREGFVHVHSGIHGCGGFPPEIYDWGPEVAQIVVTASESKSPPGALEAACPGRALSSAAANDGNSQP